MSLPENFNFDLKQLRTFRTLVQERSFTLASRKLRLGQATISNHLSALERMLGVELIRRSSKEFIITREGEIFRDFCDSVFNDIRLMREGIMADSVIRTASIASSTIPSAYILPRAIAGVRKLNPDYVYSIEVADSREVIERVKEGRVDLGIAGRMIRNTQLKYVKIYQDRIVLTAPAEGFPGSIDIQEITSLPLVTRHKGSGTRESYERELKNKGVSPGSLHTVMEFSTTEGVKEAVSAGLGAAFISDLAVSTDISSGRLRKIAIRNMEIMREFYMLYRKNVTPIPPVRALCAELGKSGSSA